MKEKYEIGMIVMADNAPLGQEPIFVFGYITDIVPDMHREYYMVDWLASSDNDEAELGIAHDYLEENIFVYRQIYEDWMNGCYDPKKDYKRPETQDR